MNKIFSLTFWVQLFMSTMLTILMIYLIKKVFAGTNIPVVSNAIENV
jgi:hypothetical protein